LGIDSEEVGVSDPSNLLLYQVLRDAEAVADVVKVEGGSVTPVTHASYLGIPVADAIADLRRQGILHPSNGSESRLEIERDRLPPVVSVLDSVGRALRDAGYEVQIPASIKGKSGVEHYFDILARQEGRQFVFDVEAPTPPTRPGRLQVLGHYAKVSDVPDTNLRPSLVVVPPLADDGRRLAEAYGVDVIEADLAQKIGERVRSFVSTPVTVGHVSTGCAQLDALLGGGLIDGRIYLVVGDVGCGKTTLALQFLIAAAHRGERGMLVTTNSTPAEEVALAESLGFDLRAQVRKGMITVLSLTNAFDALIQSHATPEAQRRSSNRVLEELFTRVQLDNPKRIVIDTVSPFVPVRRYEEVRDFLRGLSRMNRLTLLTEEFGLDGGDTAIEEYFVTGVIVLHRRVHPSGAVERTLRVEKHRGAVHDIESHPFRVEPGPGLVIQ
jgi:KaiC/GvpD/RAD55 family RecA-like ATPase